MAVTQKDIAEYLGLSLTWVARALGGHPTVPEVTRQRVRQAAEELGYDEQSNRAARALVARRYGHHLETRVLGFVYDAGSVSDFYGAGIYEGMHAAAAEHDYDLLHLIRLRSNLKVEHESLKYFDRRTDGLIFFAPRGRDELLRNLVAHKFPVATIGASAPPGVVHIKPDNWRMAQLAVEHLLDKGHTRIAHLAGLKGHADYDERRLGFQSALRRRGLKGPVRFGVDENWSLNPTAMTQLLQMQNRPTAIVCANDRIAEGLLRVAAETGVRTPNDLSIVGMDDLPSASGLGLTTIRIDFPALGRAALQALTRLIAGDAAHDCNKVLPVELCERTSVAPPQ